MRKYSKKNNHAHLDDIQRCGWVGMGWPFMDLHLFVFFFFQLILDMLGRNFKNIEKHTIIFSMWSALCSSALASKPKQAKQNKKTTKTNQKTSQWRSMIGWDMVFFLTKKTTKTKQKKARKPRKPRRPTGPECLRHSFFFVFVCSFACPKGRMQRVESCHLFAVLHVPREGCRELSLVICLFSCQSMHMSKQRMCKEECKKRTLAIPCSKKKSGSLETYIYIYIS